MYLDRRIAFLVLIAAALLLAAQARAQGNSPPTSPDDVSVLSCDQRAADPDDPDKPSQIPGVRTVVGPASTAVVRCMAMSNVSVYQKDDVNNYRRALYQMGRALEADNQFARAFEVYQSSAKRGSAAAMLAIGAMYETGKGAEANSTEARQWYEKSAAAGHPVAKARLARNTTQPQAGSKQLATPPSEFHAEQRPGRLAIAGRDIILLGLAFPEYVTGFRRALISDFEYRQPGLGYAVAYERDDSKASVFVYDGRASLLPENLDSRTLQQHFTSVRRDVVTSKSHTRAIEGAIFELRDSDGIARFVCVSFDIEQNGRALDDFLCLTLWRDRYVKVRITQPAGGQAKGEMEKFMKSWIEAMWPRELRASSQAMTAERLLRLVYLADLIGKRCSLALSSAQALKLAELETSLQARARFSNAQAQEFRAAIETRVVAAGAQACDNKSRFAIDHKAVVETMLGK